MARTRQQEAGHGSFVELILIVGLALGLFLVIQAFLVKPFRIPSESMVPTLSVSQRVLVDRVSPRFSDPDRGDVIVFKPPKGAEDDRCGFRPSGDSPCARPTPERSETNFIKRVVGLPGDRLKVESGRVFINGKRQDEPFIRPDEGCELCDQPREIEVPKDHYFMMGDNRGESDDSRAWGPVPKKWIVGNAFATYWPPGRIGLL